MRTANLFSFFSCFAQLHSRFAIENVSQACNRSCKYCCSDSVSCSKFYSSRFDHPSYTFGLANKIAVTPFLNSTGTRTANSTGPISSNCCFVVQDSVNEYWWQQYTTLPPVYSVVNVTSITTLVTPYSNGTVTNYETNVHTTNASFTRTQQIGFNPASLLINSAPQPLQTTTALNGSQDLGSILLVFTFHLHVNYLLKNTKTSIPCCLLDLFEVESHYGPSGD